MTRRRLIETLGRGIIATVLLPALVLDERPVTVDEDEWERLLDRLPTNEGMAERLRQRAAGQFYPFCSIRQCQAVGQPPDGTLLPPPEKDNPVWCFEDCTGPEPVWRTVISHEL